MSSRHDPTGQASPVGKVGPAGITAATLVLHSASRSQTQAIAALVAACVQPGQIITLHGNLGAGKTTFVQGLAAGLGIAGPVSSPTFILVGEHASPDGRRLVHMDAYRLNAAAEALAFGLDEILDAGDAVVAIEWAERVAPLLPADCLRVELAYGWEADGRSDDAGENGEPGIAAGQDARTLQLAAGGPASQAALDCLAAALAALHL